MNRAEMIQKISSHENYFDFVIIGGGATGIGILLEAVTRGYTAILFEEADFTKSTSSKSTKLVHGGVRYLAQGNIRLVREASLERGYLLHNAPHIVRNISFLIPVYNLYNDFLYSVGLKFYDLLAGRQSLGKSRRIGKKKAGTLLSGVKNDKLRAGILYHDGQFDDSRLAIATLQTAAEKGAVAINYMKVCGLLKDQKGRLNGVSTLDSFSNESFTVKGRTIVNATGVFADRIMEMDHAGHKISIRPSQGIHLVISKEFWPGENALMIPKTDDGRVLFAVPWLDRVVLGTTDTPVNTISIEPAALEPEIDFILRNAANYLVRPPGRKDVLSVFAGLRPLAASDDEEKTREISRSHKIIVSESGLFTMIGGKWTTFRKMAQDLVNKVETRNKLTRTPSVTRNLRLFGYNENPDYTDPYHSYGTEAEVIRKISREQGYGRILSKKLNISAARIVYAVRKEMALTVEDILARRTRALFLDVDEARKLAPQVGEILAKEAHISGALIDKQIDDFYTLADHYQVNA